MRLKNLHESTEAMDRLCFETLKHLQEYMVQHGITHWGPVNDGGGPYGASTLARWMGNRVYFSAMSHPSEWPKLRITITDHCEREKNPEHFKIDITDGFDEILKIWNKYAAEPYK